MTLENINTKVGELVGFDRTTQEQSCDKDNKGGHAKPYDSEYYSKEVRCQPQTTAAPSPENPFTKLSL